MLAPILTPLPLSSLGVGPVLGSTSLYVVPVEQIVYRSFPVEIFPRDNPGAMLSTAQGLS